MASVSEEIEIDISQKKKIRVFKCFAEKVPKFKIYIEKCDDIEGGICHGDAFLWGLYKLKNQEISDLDKDTDEYREISQRIVSYNQEKITEIVAQKESKEYVELEEIFLKALFLFQPSLVSDDFVQSHVTKVANMFQFFGYKNFLDWDEKTKAEQIEKIQESYREDFLASGYLDLKAIKALLLSTMPGKIITISSGVSFFHTVSLFRSANKVYYYDPESKEGAVAYDIEKLKEPKNSEDFVKKMESSLKLPSSIGMLSVKIVAHCSQEEEKNLDINVFLDAASKSKLYTLNDDQKADAARFCIQSHDMASLKYYVSSAGILNANFSGGNKTLLNYSSDYKNTEAAKFLLDQNISLPREATRIEAFEFPKVKELVEAKRATTGRYILNLKTVDLFNLNKGWISKYSIDYIDDVYETINTQTEAEKISFLRSYKFQSTLNEILFEDTACFSKEYDRLGRLLECINSLSSTEKKEYLDALVKNQVFFLAILKLIEEANNVRLSQVMRVLDLSVEIKNVCLIKLINQINSKKISCENNPEKFIAAVKSYFSKEKRDIFIDILFAWKEKCNTKSTVVEQTNEFQRVGSDLSI